MAVNENGGPGAWDKLSIDEKIERMRSVVKSQGEYISALEADVNRLKAHQHNPHGDVLIPLQANWGPRGLGSSTSNYF